MSVTILLPIQLMLLAYTKNLSRFACYSLHAH
jgi:hypothetical protein